MKKQVQTAEFILYNRAFFIVCVAVVFYWLGLSLLNDVYAYAIVGVIYELLWLPMIVMIFTLPPLGLFLFWKTGFSFRSLPIYGVIMVCACYGMLQFLVR